MIANNNMESHHFDEEEAADLEVKSSVPSGPKRASRPDYDPGDEVTRVITEGKRKVQITLIVRDRKLNQKSNRWYYQFSKDGQLYVDTDKEWFRLDQL